MALNCSYRQKIDYKMNIVAKTRNFLKDNQIDYLLVNSTNEYLVEYNELSENSRYHLTNFSGSTGDAIISQKDILLFVDGRYHEQADLEVDKNIVTVVKMKIGESFSKKLFEKLSPDKTLAIVATKNSQGRFEVLETTLKKKNIKIKLLDFDPISNTNKNQGQKINYTPINISITGLSTEEKIKKVTKNLKENEAILITKPEEISYVCNLRDFSKNYNSEIRGKCILKKGDTAVKLVTNDLEDELKKLKNIDKVFVDKTSITAYDYKLLKNKAEPLKENYIKLLKAVKTNEEIKHYKECFIKTDKALLATRKFIENNDNLSEFDITENLKENFYKFNAKSLSFKPIVAKDKNAALAHYSKSSTTEILKEGSLVLIDCGAYYEGGYATDITRVFVKGSPSQLQKKTYTIVLKGFLKAFRKKITQNTTGFALDKAARTLINKKKPKDFEFSHSLGHGIGISVHENPPSLAFSPLAKTPLKQNMCFTIEPGLYNPEYFGIRLENSCYLSKEKDNFTIKSFTNMPFEKKLIDFSMLTPTEKKQLKSFEVK